MGSRTTKIPFKLGILCWAWVQALYQAVRGAQQLYKPRIHLPCQHEEIPPSPHSLRKDVHWSTLDLFRLRLCPPNIPYCVTCAELTSRDPISIPF